MATLVHLYTWPISFLSTQLALELGLDLGALSTTLHWISNRQHNAAHTRSSNPSETPTFQLLAPSRSMSDIFRKSVLNRLPAMPPTKAPWAEDEDTVEELDGEYEEQDGIQELGAVKSFA